MIAGIASASAVKKQNAASVAAGNMRLAAIGGAVGASLIGVPVVRRFIAGE